MSHVISTVLHYGRQYSLCNDGKVLIDYPSATRATDVRTITSVELSVQNLFEEDLKKRSKTASETAEAQLVEALGIPRPPTYEDLHKRVSVLEGLLKEAKVPFAFIKDATLYPRIIAALGE